MENEPFAQPTRLINRAARLLARCGEKHFSGIGLTAAQMPVLAALKEAEMLSQTELARLIQVEQPTMAQLLARMERDGLIRRVPDPDDGRSSLIALTPAAREKLPQARAILQRGRAEALKGFSEEEAETLHHLLQRVIGNLEELVRK